MRLMKFSNNRIDDVILLIPARNHFVSLNDGISAIPPQYRQWLGRERDPRAALSLFADGDRFAYLISFPGAAADPRQSAYLLGVVLTARSLADIVTQLNPEPHSGLLLVENTTGLWVGPNMLPAEERELYETVYRAKTSCTEADCPSVEYRGKTYLVQSVDTSDGQFSLLSFVQRDEVLKPLGIFGMLLNGFTVCTLVLFLLYSWVTYRQIHTPLRRLMQLIKHIEQGTVFVEDDLTKKDEFGYVYKQFNEMARQIRHLIKEVLEKKIFVKQVQLDLLQSQINPHFLYNCLYLGYRMAKDGETEHVAKLCKYLGDYYHYAAHNQIKEVTLQQEWENIGRFLDIHQLRLAHRLRCAVHPLPEELADFVVPALIVQPLVENAVQHSVDQRSGGGTIEVRGEAGGGCILIHVQNDGRSLSEEEAHRLMKTVKNPSVPRGGKGLWNVFWRLRYKYGKDADIRVALSPEATVFTLVIPAVPGAAAAPDDPDPPLKPVLGGNEAW